MATGRVTPDLWQEHDVAALPEFHSLDKLYVSNQEPQAAEHRHRDAERGDLRGCLPQEAWPPTSISTPHSGLSAGLGEML